MTSSKRFQENVESLFRVMVTTRTKEAHTAEELLMLLKCKVTLPLLATWENDVLKLVYYNVSVEVTPYLAHMRISYNSDTRFVICELQHCSLFQLSEFVLALERDIPQWEHMSKSEAQLTRACKSLDRRCRSLKSDITRRLTSVEDTVSEAEREYLMVQFFNMKAMETMLQNDTPYWKDKQSVGLILDTFQVLHLEPPLEEWDEEWDRLQEECSNKREKRIQEIDRRERMRQKAIHLAKLSEMKCQALLRAIQLHPGLECKLWAAGGIGNYKDLHHVSYEIELIMDEASQRFSIPYTSVQTHLPMVVDCIKQINDMMPELMTQMAIDGKDGELHIRSSVYSSYYSAHQSLSVCRTRPDGIGYSSLKNAPSVAIVDRINALIRETKCKL